MHYLRVILNTVKPSFLIFHGSNGTVSSVGPGNDYEFGKDLEGDTAVNFKV